MWLSRREFLQGHPLWLYAKSGWGRVEEGKKKSLFIQMQYKILKIVKSFKKIIIILFKSNL